MLHFIKIKKPKIAMVLFIVIFAILTLVGCAWFINSSYFLNFKDWVGQHYILFLVILFTVKVIAIVWPPLPGGTLTLASIAVIGWPTAYIIDFLGNTVGGTIAYLIARKWGLKIIKSIFTSSVAEKVQRLKIKDKHQLEAAFLLSLVLGVVMVELASYSLGFLKVKYINFFIGNSLSHLIRNIPIYYLVSNFVTGQNFLISILILAVGVPLLYKARKRYFDYME